MRIFILLNILILVIILLRKLMSGKVSCKEQYFSWVIVPLFVMVCSFVSIPVAVEVQREVSGYRSAADYVEADHRYTEAYEASAAAENIMTETVQPEFHVRKTVDYKTVLISLWLIGSAVVAAGFIANNISFAKKIRKEREYYAKSEHGNLNVYKIKGLDSPFLFWNSIYIPDGLEKDPENYALSVYHEYCHYDFGDCFWNVIRSLFVTVLWFDPIVWIAYFLVQHDSELAVDEAVIEMIGEDNRIRYGEMLLNYISNISGYSRLNSVATSMNGKSKSFMKKRVIKIAKRSNVSKYAAIAAIVVLSAVCVCLLLKPYFVYVDANDQDITLQSSGQDEDTVKTSPSESADTFTVLQKNDGITYDTDNLTDAEKIKIPDELMHDMTLNCCVTNVTSDYIYITVRGIDNKKMENIHRIYRYEYVDGKQGRLKGYVDIDKEINGGYTCCTSELDVFEADGKTYVTMDIWNGPVKGAEFYIYEGNFDNHSLTLDRGVFLDDVYPGSIEIWKTAYSDGVIYAFGYLTRSGHTDSVYYEITDDDYVRVEADNNNSWKYDRILFPVFEL